MIKPYEATIITLGQFDFLDSELSEIEGGEVVVFDQIDQTITASNSAPDVFDGYQYRTILRIATGADAGPFFFADVPGGSTSFRPGFESSTMFSQNTVFAQTADASSKIGVYGQEAFFILNSDVVDSTTVHQGTLVNSDLYVDANGHLTTDVSASGKAAAKFIEFQNGTNLRGYPKGFQYATEHTAGDSIIVYKMNS